MANSELTQIRDGIIAKDLQKIEKQIKALAESIRHLDAKVDFLHADFDELDQVFRLHERIGYLEQCLAEAREKNKAG